MSVADPVIDRRTSLGSTATMHALIIGISAYPELPPPGQPQTEHSHGLEQLSSTALAAYRVYEWLVDPGTKLPVPLATVRMLLCPSAEEIAVEPKLAAFRAQWGIQEVVKAAKEWRKDAAGLRAHHTFFYFAGHGAQRTLNDSVMLLPEFGNGVGGELSQSIDTGTLRNGMAPAQKFPEIARTQFYFIDACRMMLDGWEDFETLKTFPIFDSPLPGLDDRRAPLFFAAIPGSAAKGFRGKQTLFSEILLKCLRGDAGEAMKEDANGKVPWRVSVHSLDAALTNAIRAINEERGTEQDYDPASPRQADICFLDSAPKVEVTVEVDPANVAALLELEVTDYKNTPVWQVSHPLQPYPCKKPLEAGQYSFSLTFNPPQGYQPYRQLHIVMPPYHPVLARWR
jgi:Caspase domain